MAFFLQTTVQVAIQGDPEPTPMSNEGQAAFFDPAVNVPLIPAGKGGGHGRSGGSGGSGGGAGKGEGGVSSFDVFAERQRAFNDFVRAVAEYKLAEAQAELYAAQASSEFARASILWTIAGQLNVDLDRLNRANRVADKQIDDINRRAHYAMHLLSGRRMADFQGCVSAYKTFETQAKYEGDQTLFLPLNFDKTHVTGADFFDYRDDTTRGVDPQKSDLRNALTLIDWTFQMQYVSRSGSAANEVFSDLFRAIGSVAQRSMEQIDDYVTKMRSRTYQTWSPVQIVGIKPNPAQTSILDNPGPNKAS